MEQEVTIRGQSDAIADATVQFYKEVDEGEKEKD